MDAKDRIILEQRTCKSVLKEYGESYFLFLDNPSIEPTNNAAEQEVRTLVIDRIITHRGIAATKNAVLNKHL